MDGLRFASPYALLLLLLVPPLALLVRSGAARGGIRLGALPPEPAERTWRTRLQPLPVLLRLAAVTLLILALARPQRGEAASDVPGEGIDIVLAFDISSSMTQPYRGTVTRLDAARDVLREFVASRQNDRVGLVVFQATALRMSPLTDDYNALSQSVDSASRIQLEDGTAIGTAIGESVNLLRDSDAASRIVILLTDGENNAHEIEPLAAARIAERLGVRVYTIGVVSPSREGPRSTLNVDEAALREIAEVTSATYNRAEDPEALARVYEHIDELEKSRFEGRAFTRYAEAAPWLLAAAVVLVVVEQALRLGPLRRLA
jgi:Ca-activated chloride channel family protein